MPLWSVEEWRVRIACSYSALGVWRPIKLRGYGGRIKSRRFVSSYPDRRYLSSFVETCWQKLSSAAFMFLLFLIVDLSDMISLSYLGRWAGKVVGSLKTNRLTVPLLKCVLLALSYFKGSLLHIGAIMSTTDYVDMDLDIPEEQTIDTESILSVNMITRSHLKFLCWQNLFSSVVMVVLVATIDLRNILAFPCWGEWQTRVVVPRITHLLIEVSLKCVMVTLSYLKLLLLLSGDIETNPGPAYVGSTATVYKMENSDSDRLASMAFLMVVMATLLLESGNVERNPGPVEIDKRDWAEVVKYLYELNDNQIKLLGGLLGLSAANVARMRDLPADMVKAWLRREEKVTQNCGQQLTWEVLAQKLREMVPPQTHIATKILEERCTQGVVLPVFFSSLNEDIPLNVGDHHAVLCDILKLHATKWREIGLHLGFLPRDLDNIQVAPLLIQTAPVSWLNAMLEKFLEGGAMMSVLETALRRAGLGVTASQLRDDVQRLLAQGMPKLNLSLPKYAERLKALYSKRTMPDYLKGRPLPTSKFVSLALISRVHVSKKDMYEFTRTTVIDGDIDTILMKKAPLDLKHIGKLKNGSLATCMLLQGGPGTGKTTFAWNLCREWESGELFQEYSLVVFIPLRRKWIREAKDIRELFSIGNSDSETKDNISMELLNSQGESVLLVLDGYNELPQDVQKDSMISKIIDGEYLHKAGVLVTSRPSACSELYDKCCRRDENFQHIEVLGFTRDKIKAYIEDNVDSKQLPQFNQYLSSHPKILAMMYNPLQCALTVEVCKKLFEDGSYLPKTRTKLYETNVLMTMSREHPTLPKGTNSLQKLPKAFHKKFVKLCRLAYDGIAKRQIIFEDVPEEIKEIVLLVSEPDLDSVLPSSENYNFFHLSIQEFCAAYYICSLPEQEQTTLLSRHSSEGHFREVIIFVCGVSSNPERTMDIVYSRIQDTLLLFHCAFESQCDDTCSSLVKKMNSSIDLNGGRLLITPSDMSAVGFVLCKSKHPIKALDLYNCFCDDDGLRALINQFYLTLEEHSSLAIEEINLGSNNIGADGAKCLSEGLKYCPKLQTLNLHSNNISDDGAKCLSEGLKYCSELQTLDLSRNNIGDDGVKCLSDEFKYCPKLQELKLSENVIGDDGAKCLSEGIKNCPKLEILVVSQNVIGTDGARCLSDGRKYCPQLKLFLNEDDELLDQLASFMITEHPQPQLKKFGEKISFSVIAKGIGEQLSYQWKKDNDDITFSTYPCCEGATTSVLSIVCALPLYEGQYKCLVSNELSEVESQTAQLQVKRITGPTLTVEELELMSKMLIEEKLAYGKLKHFDIDFSDQSLTFQEVCNVLSSLDIAEHVIGKLTSELDNLKHFQAYQLALQQGVKVSIRYFKLLFYGPPRVGKTSARRRLVGEILNLQSARSCNPETREIEVSSSTGVGESSHVIVQLDEQKHKRTTALLTTTDESMPCKWMYIKNFNESDLDDELVLLYRFIHEAKHEATPTSGTESQPIPGRDQTSITDAAKPVSDSSDNELVSNSTSTSVTKETKSNDRDTRPAINKATQQRSIKSTVPADGGSNASETAINSKPEPDWKETNKRVIGAFNSVLKSKNCNEYLNVLLKGTSLINMIDTGGQPAFLEMLPVLTVGPAMYLVFLNLIQNLKDRYEVRYATTKEGETSLGTSSYTIREVIFQILSSIVAFSQIEGNKKFPDSPQAVLIVGTHKDNLDSTAAVVEKDKAVQRELNQVLQSTICSELLCRASDSDNSLVLAINNETGDQEEVQAMRKRLEEIIKSKFEKYDIPATWLMFNLFLRKLALHDIHENSEGLCSTSNVGVIPLEQCKHIAEELELHVTDLEDALWFFHHIVGSLMYFPEVKELNDIIICDPQVVFDSVTTLIIQTFKSDDTASNRFKETGQFSYEDIEKAVRGTSSEFLPPAKLICLLEYRNIIAPIEAPPHSKSSKWYFFPAILECATNEQLLQFEQPKNPSDPPPLMIHFKFGFVPMGLFCAVIAKLVSQIHSQKLGWVLHCDADTNKPLYKNLLTFHTGATYDVTLISQPKRFEVHLTQPQTENAESSHASELEVCRAVLLAICDTLDEVISQIKHLNLTTSTTKEPIYQLGFKCPQHLHSDSDDLLLNKATSDSSRFPKLLWYDFLSNASCFQCLYSKEELSKNEVFNLKFLNCLAWFGISNLNDLKLLLITGQPKSQVKLYRDEVSFKVEVSETGTKAKETGSFQYQWFKDNTEITLETHPYCRGADESILYINAVLAQYEGNYKCKVRSQNGTEVVRSNDAKLEVGTPLSSLLEKRSDSFRESIIPPVSTEPHCQLLPLVPPKLEVVDHKGKMILGPDDGITINVPPGAVADNDSIRVQIQSFVPASNETIVLPQGLKLLSPVYHISTFSKKFREEIQLSMLHYAKLLTRKDVSELKFLHSTDKTSPYKFTELSGGEFDFDSCTGRVFLKSFCIIAQAGPERISEEYSVYFIHPIPTLNSKCMCAMFSACYRHNAFLKYLEDQMKSKFPNAQPFNAAFKHVELAEDSKEFELVIPKEDVKRQGYEVKILGHKTTKISVEHIPPLSSATSADYPIISPLPFYLLYVELLQNCTRVGGLECDLKVDGIKGDEVFVLRAEAFKLATTGLTSHSMTTADDSSTSFHHEIHTKPKAVSPDALPHLDIKTSTLEDDKNFNHPRAPQQIDPTKTLDGCDWAEICRYLNKLDQKQIKRLGGVLGLNVFNLGKMKDLPDDMVEAWLRKEGKVTEKCGDHLTWGTLVKALKEIDQTGIADVIRKDKCI